VLSPESHPLHLFTRISNSSLKDLLISIAAKLNNPVFFSYKVCFFFFLSLSFTNHFKINELLSST
jgi:hypothetical protein